MRAYKPKDTLKKFCEEKKQSGIISNACKYYFGTQTQETLSTIDTIKSKMTQKDSALKTVLKSYHDDMEAIKKSINSIESVEIKK